jgi:hypothetical protein
MEATVGFEPTNRGFADPRLRPLGYVALINERMLWNSGAEEETRTPTSFRPLPPQDSVSTGSTTSAVQS